MTSKMKRGGHPLDAFVAEHFTKIGEWHPKTKRWHMQCNYCPSERPPIEHRDTRCMQHISNPQNCPNVPEDIRLEARRLLMQKGGIEVVEPSDDENMSASDRAQKKVKGPGGQVIAMKKGGMDAFLDRVMSVEEINKANVQMLRQVVCYRFEYHRINNNHVDFLSTQTSLSWRPRILSS
jgi:hypothetical protein